MLIFIVILGFLARLINLNQSLWLDEAISAVTVRGLSYEQIISVFSKSDFHPPLYYLALKFWTGFFGATEVSLRFPSVIFGCGTIIFSYLITRFFAAKRTALFAALLVAFNPLLVYYSQEARMYSLTVFLVTGAVWFALKKNPLWYFLFLTASLYTDYLPWFMIPVYIFISTDRKSTLKWTGLALLATLPWLPFLYVQITSSLSAGNGSWGDLLGRVSFKNVLLFPIKFTFGRISFDDKFVYGAIFGTGVFFYLLAILKGGPRKLWSWLLLPVVGGILLSTLVPVLSYFRFLFVVPAFLILTSFGTYRSRALMILTLAVAIFGLVWFNLNSKFFREDWRSFTSEVTTTPGIVVMPSMAQDAPIEYYQPVIIRQDLSHLDLHVARRIYLLRYVQEVFDPGDRLRTILENANFKKVSEKNFNGLVAWIYER